VNITTSTKTPNSTCPCTARTPTYKSLNLIPCPNTAPHYTFPSNKASFTCTPRVRYLHVPIFTRPCQFRFFHPSPYARHSFATFRTQKHCLQHKTCLNTSLIIYLQQVKTLCALHRAHDAEESGSEMLTDLVFPHTTSEHPPSCL